MASNQVDVPRDDILKRVNLILIARKWVKFGSTSDLKQKKERFWSYCGLDFNINLSLRVCKLWYIHVYHI